MTKEEVLQHDKKFRYMLLSRMQSDCEYYLNYGNRNPKRLWAGDEQRQIEYRYCCTTVSKRMKNRNG